MSESPGNDILERILRTKRSEIAERSRTLTRESLEKRIPALPPCRDFAGALTSRMRLGSPAVIAEIKRASPSAGVIREDFDPAWLARRYEAGGAAALSVLTDRTYFQGDEAYVLQARSACRLPVLRKEFIIDPWQVWETRALCADAILLIAAALDDDQLSGLSGLARQLGLGVLVEVHDLDEIERVHALGDVLVGVNNRDLRRFETRLETSLELAPLAPEPGCVIAESGIHGAGDMRRLLDGGISGFLIGEGLMRVEDPGAALSDMLSEAGKVRA